jgi:hypothetical protein
VQWQVLQCLVHQRAKIPGGGRGRLFSMLTGCFTSALSVTK